MQALPLDPLAAIIALAVLAVIGFYVWHVLAHTRSFASALMRYADRRAEVQRDMIDGEAGRGESNARRAIQMLLMIALTALCTVAALRKFGLV